MDLNSFVTSRLTAALALLFGATGFSLAQTATPAAIGKAQSDAQAAVAKKQTFRSGAPLDPNALGDFSRDQVFTAVTPCRIVDTRIAGGALSAGTTRTFDVDGSSFSSQGGVNASCAIPLGVASAVAMTITVTQSTSGGYLTAWGLGTQPQSSVVNFVSGDTTANTTIVPVVPGSGADFSIYASATTDVVIDVVGYFAAPISTALDCTTVSSAVTAVPQNVYTAVDAFCPTNWSVTGGGTFPTEGTLGRIGIWTDGSPSGNSWRTWVDNQANGSRTIQTFARCCRVPGR